MVLHATFVFPRISLGLCLQMLVFVSSQDSFSFCLHRLLPQKKIRSLSLSLSLPQSLKKISLSLSRTESFKLGSFTIAFIFMFGELLKRRGGGDQRTKYQQQRDRDKNTSLMFS